MAPPAARAPSYAPSYALAGLWVHLRDHDPVPAHRDVVLKVRRALRERRVAVVVHVAAVHHDARREHRVQDRDARPVVHAAEVHRERRRGQRSGDVDEALRTEPWRWMGERGGGALQKGWSGNVSYPRVSRAISVGAGGGGGLARGLGIRLFAFWRRLWASRHCSF